MFCPKCGKENIDGARFCNACGQPVPATGAPAAVAPPPVLPGNPPAPPAKKRSGLWTCLIVAIVLIVLFLVLVVIVIVAGFLLATGSSAPAPSTSPQSQNSSASVDVYAGGSEASSAAPTSPQRAAALEQALRSGDAAAVLPFIHPDYHAGYKATILSAPARMTRAADVLATRQLVSEHDRLAQYEVTDGSRKSFAVFEKVGGQWVLVAF
jgi:hypothetical protein